MARVTAEIDLRAKDTDINKVTVPYSYQEYPRLMYKGAQTRKAVDDDDFARAVEAGWSHRPPGAGPEEPIRRGGPPAVLVPPAARGPITDTELDAALAARGLKAVDAQAVPTPPPAPVPWTEPAGEPAVEAYEFPLVPAGARTEPVSTKVTTPANPPAVGPDAPVRVMVEHVQRLDSIGALQALRAEEEAHPTYTGGRKGVLEAIDERIALLKS